MTVKKAAKRPARRTVSVHLNSGSPFDGWEATAYVDVSIKTWNDARSMDMAVSGPALRRIIADHNMPDADGNVAADVLDVEPWDGLAAVLEAITEAMQALPPR